MNKFYNFSANVKDSFDNKESNYMEFCKLLHDAAHGDYETGMNKSEADEMIRGQFRLILGLSEDAKPKEVRRAINAHKNEIFAIIEDTIDDMLTSGWTANEFFRDFVDVRNLAIGDENEFITEDKTILTVGKLAGDHWDIDRQKLGVGESFRVSTGWVGLGVYEEFERIMTGRADWSRLVNKIYEAMDLYVDGLVYNAVMSAGKQVLPGSDQFYKTAALNASSKATLLTMIEDVQAANRGTEVVIMGTKTALARLSALADTAWISAEDKTDRRNLGRVGIWEGVRLVEIPQVFAKNDTTTKLVDPNVLLIMPVADNKFVKFVYEGDSMIKEVSDNTTNTDMTYEFKYMTKIGVATVIGRYFGTWNIIAE